MADHAAGDDIFVYTGGRAPWHVVNAIIDESVEEIDDEAFRNSDPRSVVCHEGLLKVGCAAFHGCRSLQLVKMPGVKIIENDAFSDCRSLTHVEFDKLETVGDCAFTECHSLQQVKLPKVKNIGAFSFLNSSVQDAELGDDLETVGSSAFLHSNLRRIAIPLKNGLFEEDANGTYGQFHHCLYLTTVELVGGVHKTVASLHLESWRNEMNEEIQQINQILPSTESREKTNVIRQWIQSVISRIDHYKAEHRALLKEVVTLLELTLWKAKLADFTADDNKKCSVVCPWWRKIQQRRPRYTEGAKREARITSGADIIIKNVLPFLKME